MNTRVILSNENKRMHLASLKSVNAYGLHEGSYLLDDNNAAESLARGEATLSQPCVNVRPLDPTQDYNGKKILLVRSGAIGDILFTTPTLREIKKRWPQSEITFSCLKEFAPILEHNPDVDHIVNYPILLEDFTKFDAHFVISDTIHDGNPKTHTKHAVDLILEMGGLETDSKELRYEMSFDERLSAWTRFPRSSRSRIGIAYRASIPSRTWPKNNISEFIKLAIKDGYEVILFGQPGDTGFIHAEPPPHLLLTDRLNPPLSLRETLLLISTCDAFVGTDSALLHVAGSLKIPSIGLFGSFPSEIRTKYAESIKAIDGAPAISKDTSQPCSPCFHTFRTFPIRMWPEHGPCRLTGKCEVLAAISPETVLTKLVRHMRKFKAKNGVAA